MANDYEMIVVDDGKRWSKVVRDDLINGQSKWLRLVYEALMVTNQHEYWLEMIENGL